MADAFMRLIAPIRKYIYEQGWEALRPIQHAAIRVATETDDNFILSAPTAAGKTEAAFLPAISSVPSSDWHNGVQILMISPLVALINDQFQRLWGLCRALDIPVTAWHGEAKTSAKRKLVAHPEGIVLITPESLEAMLDTHPERVSRLFSCLSWVLVDECHSFLSGQRGVQLRSLLQRLEKRSEAHPRYVGMSATVVEDNYDDLRYFFPRGRDTRIVVDHAKRIPITNLHLCLPAQQGDRPEDPSDTAALYDALFAVLKKENLLIFPNSRRRVEEIAHALQERVKHENLFIRVMAHHSSMEKGLRLEAEEWVKSGFSRFALCATSTLELGIDIGTVDAVCQVDAPFSATSLAQRLGRSGRGEMTDPETGKKIAEPPRLHLFATREDAFWQAVTALEMVKTGQLERLEPLAAPYDVFAHQVLALALETSGLPLSDYYALSDWPVFSFLTRQDQEKILHYLLEQEYLEMSEEGTEMFLGLAGERIATRHDFYAMFQTERDFTVLFGKERIGTLPLTPEVVPGAHILLSARVWSVDSVDEKAQKIFVKSAKKGKAPLFAGSYDDVSAPLRRLMPEVLYAPPALVEKDAVARDAFKRLRTVYAPKRHVQWTKEGDEAELTLFLGSRAERTLFLLLRALTESPSPRIFWDSRRGRLFGEHLRAAILRLRYLYTEEGDDVISRIRAYLEEDAAMLTRLLGSAKYAILLSKEYKIRYILKNLCLTSLKEVMEEICNSYSKI